MKTLKYTAGNLLESKLFCKSMAINHGIFETNSLYKNGWSVNVILLDIIL